MPRSARRVRAGWDRLSASTLTPERFEPGLLTGLPEPARRYLAHAIEPGTPLWRCATVRMIGQIRIGSWGAFCATQVVAPDHGYVWAADARLRGVPVSGYDSVVDGAAEMRWRLLGIVPVISVRGPDVARSAAGRLASEMALVPTAFRGACWSEGQGPDHVVATWQVAGQQESVTLDVGEDGRLRSVLVQRWGNPDGGAFGRHPFGATFSGERTEAGVTVPEHVRAGWARGTDREQAGESFRARITAVAFA